LQGRAAENYVANLNWSTPGEKYLTLSNAQAHDFGAGELERPQFL
jgi:hypothetical protein